MNIRKQRSIFIALLWAVLTLSVAGQDTPHNMSMSNSTPKNVPTATPSPQPTVTPMDIPMEMPTPAQQVATPTPAPATMSMPMPATTPTPATPPVPAGGQKTLANLNPEKDFPEPIADNERFGSTLFDILEFRPRRGGDSDFRWDIEGWYGTDKNKFWYKSEGERNTAFKADYDIDIQFLWGRIIHPYFDLQAGIRFETQTFKGANVTRPQAVIGFEGLLPYLWELESALFVDPQGNVSGRTSLTKDFLFTNRWIMQGRFETNAAVQNVERFTTGRGLNNIETGLRLRYEFSRRFAPYFGLTYDRSFFNTARFVRRDGGDPSQLRFVSGIRVRF